MKKIKLTLFAICAALLWVGVAQAQRYIDNGDGTVTDTSTNLMWEKKTGIVGLSRGVEGFAPSHRCPGDPSCADVHDVNNLYTWSNSLDAPPNGGAFIDFLGSLNGTSTNATNITSNSCFAKRCTWRLPSVSELETIYDFRCGGSFPCIDAIFGPTYPYLYWSAVDVPIPGYVHVLDFGNNNPDPDVGPNGVLPADSYASVRAVADFVPGCTPVAYLFRHAEEEGFGATKINQNTLLPVGNRHAALYISMIKRFQSTFNYCPVSAVFAMARKNAPNGAGLPTIMYPNGIGTTNPFFTAEPLTNAVMVDFQEPYPTVFNPITSTDPSITEIPGMVQADGLLYEYLSYQNTRNQLAAKINDLVNSETSVAIFWSSQGMGEAAKVLGQPIPAYANNSIPATDKDYKAPRNSIFVFSNYKGNKFNTISVPAMVKNTLTTGQFIQCFNYIPENGGSFDANTFFCRYDGSLNYKSPGTTPIPNAQLDELEGAICDVDKLAPYGNPSVYIGSGVIDGKTCF